MVTLPGERGTRPSIGTLTHVLIAQPEGGCAGVPGANLLAHQSCQLAGALGLKLPSANVPALAARFLTDLELPQVLPAVMCSPVDFECKRQRGCVRVCVCVCVR